VMAGLFSRLFGRREAGGMTWIEPAQLQRRLSSDDALVLLDVRGPDEFAGPLGHIAGAVNLPLTELPTHLAELAAAPRPLVIVCLTDKRSSRAAADLVAAGHPQVAVLRGGMARWRREVIDAAS
jgi:rhodanese-related sulfurtransferase